jgi:hypothetical protein
MDKVQNPSSSECLWLLNIFEEEPQGISRSTQGSPLLGSPDREDTTEGMGNGYWSVG